MIVTLFDFVHSRDGIVYGSIEAQPSHDVGSTGHVIRGNWGYVRDNIAEYVFRKDTVSYQKSFIV